MASISLEGKIGIGLALLFGIGAGAVAVWPETKEIGWAIIYLSASGLIFLALYHWHEKTKRKKMVPLIGGIGFAIASIVCFGWYYFHADTNPKSKEDRWIWNALTEQEIDTLYLNLRGKEHYSIQVSCNRSECSELAASFDKLFKRLGWPSIIGDAGLWAVGVTGIRILPGDQFAEALKDAIETTTVLRPEVIGQREPKTPELTNIIIGTKPSSMASGPRPKTGNRQAVEAKEFSWIWDALTPAESEKLFEVLKDKNPKRIGLSYDYPKSSNLAGSIQQVLEKRGWTVEYFHRGLADGVTGLAIARSDETSMVLKNAIEASTTFRVNIGGLLSDAGNRIVLVIGARPPPNQLPDAMKKHIARLAQNLKRLSIEIGRFAADRGQLHATLPNRLGPLPSQDEVFQHMERQRKFSNDTMALYEERFGADITKLLSELRIMGIERAGNIDQPEDVAKWCGVIGRLLEEEKITEARLQAVDMRFWFRQRR